MIQPVSDYDLVLMQVDFVLNVLCVHHLSIA